jgi:hypothetical protein
MSWRNHDHDFSLDLNDPIFAPHAYTQPLMPNNTTRLSKPFRSGLGIRAYDRHFVGMEKRYTLPLLERPRTESAETPRLSTDIRASLKRTLSLPTITRPVNLHPSAVTVQEPTVEDLAMRFETVGIKYEDMSPPSTKPKGGFLRSTSRFLHHPFSKIKFRPSPLSNELGVEDLTLKAGPEHVP